MKTKFETVMGKITEAEQIKIFASLSPEKRAKMKAEIKKKISDLKILLKRL